MLIDIYTHLAPPKALDRIAKLGARPAHWSELCRSLAGLHDFDLRFRQMDPFGDYRQVVAAPTPPLEDVTTPGQGTRAARIVNDALAETVARHEERFPAFVAALAMHDVDGAVAEVHRAVGELGAAGVQMFTHVAGRPLDDPRFLPVFDAIAGYGLPIWLHPARDYRTPDYDVPPELQYATWAALGWPYATSVAMVRLAATGIFDRHPGLKIVTHHLGGMIPLFANRVVVGFPHIVQGTPDARHLELRKTLKRPFAEYLRMFYGDTVVTGCDAAFRCGLEYFGDTHVLFATDTPFSPPSVTVEMMARIALDPVARARICSGNAETLLKRNLGYAPRRASAA